MIFCNKGVVWADPPPKLWSNTTFLYCFTLPFKGRVIPKGKFEDSDLPMGKFEDSSDLPKSKFLDSYG